MPVRNVSNIFTSEGRILESYCLQVPRSAKAEMLWRWYEGNIECVAINIIGDGTLANRTSLLMTERRMTSVPIAFDFLAEGMVHRIRNSGSEVQRTLVNNTEFSTEGELTQEDREKLDEMFTQEAINE